MGHTRQHVSTGGGGLYRHTIHPSVGNVTLYNGRLSAEYGGSSGVESGSLAAAGAGPTSGSCGGGGSGGGLMGTRQPALWSARSDPAIAATGLRADSYADISEPLPAMRSFTFLRLGPEILQPSYQTPWMKFMWKMREGGFVKGMGQGR